MIPARGEPMLVVPRLELAAAQASPASGLGLDMVPWEETEDPYALIARRLGRPGVVGLADQMWALMVLRLRDALPGTRQVLASAALRDLRMRKSPAEVGALREAGAAIDRVHARVPGWLKACRTEREVGTLTSRRPSWPRGTSRSTSSSSAPARTRPARTTRCPTGCRAPGMPSWWTSAG